MKSENGKYIFSKAVDINTNIQKISAYHLDTNNLPNISPPFPKASIVKISEIPLKLNSVVIIKLHFIIFSVDWKIRIKRLEKPNLIEDYQEKGIFDYWSHSHIFEEIDGAIRMIDHVEFIPPFGLVGRLALPFIYLQLSFMFNYRHNKTKIILEG